MWVNHAVTTQTQNSSWNISSPDSCAWASNTFLMHTELHLDDFAPRRGRAWRPGLHAPAATPRWPAGNSFRDGPGVTLAPDARSSSLGTHFAAINEHEGCSHCQRPTLPLSAPPSLFSRSAFTRVVKPAKARTPSRIELGVAHCTIQPAHGPCAPLSPYFRFRLLVFPKL